MALAGVVILALSLLTANNLTMRGSGVPGQQWKFYLGREILPDNILYPLLMIRDRLVLDYSSPSDQVTLKLAYAEERFATAQRLLEHDEGSLAVSTITKYQKYVISAGYQVLELEAPEKNQLEAALSAAYRSLERTEGLSKLYPEYDLNSINQLRDDTRIVITKLEEQLAKLEPTNQGT